MVADALANDLSRVDQVFQYGVMHLHGQHFLKRFETANHKQGAQKAHGGQGP